jgi:RNA polymerase sigma factor (sigma-70 family)
VSSRLSDAGLVARCRAGDQAAWGELVERFSRYVHAIAVQAYRLPPADAEDVFQEVFARTYEHIDRLRDEAAIRPWIGQLTRRLCIDRLRAGRHEDVRETGETPDPGAVDQAIARLDEAMWVREALEQLGPPCSEVLDRFFCRDESYQTICEELGLAHGTLASRISRCLAKLRAEIQGRNPPPSASGGR